MEQAEDLARVLVGCSEHVSEALRGLRNGSRLSSHLVEIHRLENEATGYSARRSPAYCRTASTR